MKSLVTIALIGLAASAQAQTAYRCPGNVFTNITAEAKAKGCRPVEGNITVIEGTRVNGNGAVKMAVAPSAVPGSTQRVDAGEQKARDSDARLILESELKKAEARQAELAREYNNGEPEKLGPETRNHQKYLDRVAELKASIARNESDIAGIRRELGRAGPAPTASK